jgi:hypothetical protein
MVLESSGDKTSKVIVEQLRISELDADDFVTCVKNAIDENRIVKPYNALRNALVFSFDTELSAFANYSKGWHKNRRMRPYFENVPTVFEKLEGMMLLYRETGGRVFIDNKSAFFVDRESKRTNLCSVSWPRERDIVNEIRDYWDARRLPTFTITLAARGAA